MVVVDLWSLIVQLVRCCGKAWAFASGSRGGRSMACPLLPQDVATSGSQMSSISRRSVASGLLAAPFLNLRGAHGQDKRKITLTLPFLAEGSNAFAFVAKANGYWDEAGLDVQISRGYGSVVAAQAVATGKFQFGLASGSAGIQQAAKGLSITSIACCGYDATMGLCVLKDSPIKSPKDLAGKRLGSTISSGEYPFLDLFGQRAGFDLKKVQIVQTDANVRQRLLMTGDVDVISGYAISFVPPLVTQKYEPRSMLFSHYGMTFYNNVLLTQKELLRDERKLCADMAAGIIKAVKFTMLDPEGALKLFLKQVPETALSATGAEAVRLGIGIFNVGMLTDAARLNGIGYTAPEDYKTMTDLVMTYAASPGDSRPDVASSFTNDFVGSVRCTPDEWARAEAAAQPFRQYLG
jgi:NitT/TauT family transport system substrate-binding protein